ncbi:MAG TPA: DUF1861 family protein [Lachnospiraceae bacterium]|nr:DUF1861 family protein [Lachnospiraceae bacterium]
MKEYVDLRTEPDYMKDIRLIELSSGKIGVFSRPRNDEIRKRYGSDSMIGFAVIDTLNDLTEEVIQKEAVEGGEDLAVYVNISFEFNPESFEVTNRKIIGTRSCYPPAPAKVPSLIDCTFTSGIYMREDGKVDLYGGIGDSMEGRITFEYPFGVPLI